MSEIKRVGDLEIGQDMPFQKLQWTIERIGWIVMALILLAAFIGLIGPGPLSSTAAGEKGSQLWAEYNRFERYQSPNSMVVHVGAGSAQAGDLRLSLKRDFVENIQLDHISPEPKEIEASADQFTYIFAAPDPTHPTTVTFHYEPNKFGQMPVRIGIEGGAALSFWQFYYP
jgi:hypothetical protein